MAKDILDFYVRFFCDDSGGTARDLSGDLVPGSLSGPQFSHPAVKMTGVSNAGENFLADRPDTRINGARFYMNNTATTGAWTVLNSIRGNNTGWTVTIEYGTAGAPATGDPSYSGEFILLKLDIVNEGGAIALDTEFVPVSGAAIPAWGTKA